MRKLEHVTDIEAPAATVWQVLTATEQYDQWNPVHALPLGRSARR